MSGTSELSGTPARAATGAGADTRPRQVMNVAVLAESELGSEAQRERRKRILDAPLAIASKGGYEAVQMRAVAERADVAVGTLYRYFPSKVHLLVSALGREFERIDAKTDRAVLAALGVDATVLDSGCCGLGFKRFLNLQSPFFRSFPKGGIIMIHYLYGDSKSTEVAC